MVCVHFILHQEFYMHYIIWASRQRLRQILLLSFPFLSGRNDDTESVSDFLNVTHLLHSNIGICLATKAPYSYLLC